MRGPAHGRLAGVWPSLTDGVVEPVPPRLLAVLRSAVLEHAVAEHRRVFVPLLHVGTPGGPERVHAVRREEATDHSLRTDVVAALLGRGPTAGEPPLVWLTRPGPLELQDVDVAWLAATLAASAERASVDRAPLAVVVVNRHGWMDPRTGAGRTWVRLRRR